MDSEKNTALQEAAAPTAAQPAAPAAPAVPAPAKKKRRKKHSVKKIIALMVVLGVAAALVVPRVTALLRGPLPAYAPMTDAAAGDITQTLSTTGTLVSGKRVVVTSPVSAPLAEVSVQQGQIVRAGDPLVTYDTKALERSYRQAAAAYQSGQLQKGDALSASDTAQKQFNDAAANLSNLAVQKDSAKAAVASLTSQYGALSAAQQAEPAGVQLKAALDAAAADLAAQEQALTAAKANYDALEKSVLSDSGRQQLNLAQVPAALAVQTAREDLDAARAGVSAPISGAVTSLTAVQGSPAAAYGALCTIESLEDVNVDIALSRYDLAKVQIGQRATVTALGKTYTGTLTAIDAMATAGAATGGTTAAYVHARIHLDAPDESLRLGLEASVSLLTGEAKNVVTLPIGAVNTDVSGTFVYAVEDGTAVRREVTTGLSSDTMIEIKSGVAAGDRIVTDAANVTEGAAVSDDPSLQPAASASGMMFG